MIVNPDFRDCISIRTQAFWLVGNVAGNSIEHRDLCLAAGAMSAALDALEGSSRFDFHLFALISSYA
jgi:hypothetical protein